MDPVGNLNSKRTIIQIFAIILVILFFLGGAIAMVVFKNNIEKNAVKQKQIQEDTSEKIDQETNELDHLTPNPLTVENTKMDSDDPPVKTIGRPIDHLKSISVALPFERPTYIGLSISTKEKKTISESLDDLKGILKKKWAILLENTEDFETSKAEHEANNISLKKYNQ